MECNCNNNNNGGVIPWVRGNRLPLCICIYQMNVGQGTVSTMAYNTMTRTPYVIQADDTVTVTMKSGFRSVEMPFTTDGNKVLVIDNGELPTGTYTVEVTIERGSGERGRWQESRQVRIYENTDEAILGEMYSIEADLFFWAKGDTGVGIANITSNPDNTLTITMTDGTTYTTQAMKGDKGDKGDQGEKGTSIVSFDVTGQTDTSVIYTVTFSDDTTQEVAVPKGPQGDTGLTGNGIASTTLNSDYTLTIAYTDGTTYTTSSIRGAQGVQGVSIIAFTQTGETSTNTLYNVVFSDGRTQSVAIPKGLKGDKGDTGNTGVQGAQGPKGDTVIIGDEQEYTLYNVTGDNTDGAMTQKAVTDALVASSISYDNSQSGLASGKVQEALDEVGINTNGMIEALGMNTYTNIGTYTVGKNSSVYVQHTIRQGDYYRIRVAMGAQAAYFTMATRSSGTRVEYVLNQATTSREIIFGATADADDFHLYSSSGASSVVIDSISRDIATDYTPMLGSGKAVKSNGVADYVDEHTTISEDILQDTTYTNIILDDGNMSDKESTANIYNCKRYQIGAERDYKVTSRVRGYNYHQIVFKALNGTVTGTLYAVTKDEVKVTYIDHSDIPENTFYIYVNGYVNDGDAISVKTDIVDVRTLAAEIPSISEDVNELKVTVYGNEEGSDIVFPTNTYLSQGTYRINYENVLKNGDTLSISCNDGYEYRAFLTDATGQSVTKYYSDGYLTEPSTIDYEDGDSQFLRILLKKSEGTIADEEEGAANITYQALRPLYSGGLVKRIKALFIGNSVSQDHVAYLPWLLKNIYGDDIDFKIFIAYKASATVKEYVENIITGNVDLDIFSVANNVEGWTNKSNFPYADMWTLYNDFDLICFEGYFNHGSATEGLVEDTSYFMPFINDLKSRQDKPFKLGYLMHQTYTTSTHSEADAWQRIVSGAEYAIANTPVSILFPCGVVTKLVNGDIPQSTLTNDNIHNQQGLPCIMGAYVLMEELARYLGLPSKVLNNQLRITSAKETALDIPGGNGTLQIGTDAQYSLCQDASIKAVKYGDYLMTVKAGNVFAD